MVKYTGYAILYLLIHIQSEFYSGSIRDAFSCLTGSSAFAVSFLGVIIFIKQFVLDFQFRYNSIEDEYDTDEDNMAEHNPLLNDDDSNYYQAGGAQVSSPNTGLTDIDNNEFVIDHHIDTDERVLNEYKGNFHLLFLFTK